MNKIKDLTILYSALMNNNIETIEKNQQNFMDIINPSDDIYCIAENISKITHEQESLYQKIDVIFKYKIKINFN